MPEKIFSIIHLGLFFLCASLFLSCGTIVKATNTEEKSPALKIPGSPLPPKSGTGVSLRVLWTVSKYVIGPNAQWGEENARKLLFKPLDINANSITFDGKTCRDIIFKKEQVKTKEYLANTYNITPQILGIEDETIEVIKTNCDLPGFDRYLRLPYGKLVICIRGVFFYFESVMNY